MLLVLFGKTSSGKTAVRDQLIGKGFKPIITYTTRPIREGEINGESYHFITEEDFKKKIDQGFFAEWKTYITEQGVWYYGSSIESLNNSKEDKVIILTPKGLEDIKNKVSNVKSIYLYSNNKTIERRLKLRKDDPVEAARRIKADNEDFKNAAELADRIVYNNENNSLYDVVNTVLMWVNRWKGGE